MNESEIKILTMISSAGESRSKAIEALRKVKEGDYQGAHSLLEQAKQIDLAAHKAQTELISHAQDHYMAAQLARDLIEELVDVFEIQNRK